MREQFRQMTRPSRSQSAQRSRSRVGPQNSVTDLLVTISIGSGSRVSRWQPSQTRYAIVRDDIRTPSLNLIAHTDKTIAERRCQFDHGCKKLGHAATKLENM